MREADQPVSVVMPVRNAMPYLDEAVASILSQTHENFELVAGDDGSTDGSGERLDDWARRDSRIRVIRSRGSGLGPSGSGNWVVGAARHELVARMDADDISRADRLRAQIRALAGDPGAVMVGSLYEYVDAQGRTIGGRDRSVFRRPRCIFPVAHGSLMFRRPAFDRVGGYRVECDYWEDVDLFLRLSGEGRVLVLPDALYRYRYSPTSARHVSDEARVARALDLGVRCLTAHREGRSYERLIEEAQRAPPPARVSLSVFAQIAFVRLWRGEPRSIFQTWAWRNASLGLSRRVALILLFAAWAWTHPPSLRMVLTWRSRFADWRARHSVADGEAKVWQAAGRRASNVTPLRAGSAETRPPDAGYDPPLPDLDLALVATGGAPGLHGQA